MNKIKPILAVLVLAGASVNAQTITENFGSGANAFSIDFVQIGNPGNAADTTGNPNPIGSVDYIYKIAKYEVSRDMINKANATAGLGIDMPEMSAIWNRPNNPATGITWNMAARFVNYLNLSKGYQIAYNFTSGSPNNNITVWGEGFYNGNNQFRHKDAYYFLPSRDEWYKAAYGSPDGSWSNFATGSNSAPIAVSGGTNSGTAVYGQSVSNGPAEIQSAGGLSSYGTMAQSGNVFEWTETAYDGTNDQGAETRELRGGSFSGPLDDLSASWRFSLPPSMRLMTEEGFRVASVPEPSSLSLLLAGGAVLMAGRRRKV